MMIKYKVNEVAKDFNADSKDVLEVIKEQTGETKKNMTALNEEELNVVFESFTQENQVEDFDAFYSLNKTKADDLAMQQAAILEELRRASQKENTEQKQEKIIEDKSQQNNKEQRPVQNQNANRTNQNKPSQNQNQNKPRPNQNQNQNQNKSTQNQNKPTQGQYQNKQNQKPGQKFPQQNKSQQAQKPQYPVANTNTEKPKNSIVEGVESDVKKPIRRTVDTRTSNVDIERYNEKYDNLAQEKVKTDNIVKKQKINQRSAQRGRHKSAKRETEAERMRRIAMERKAKPITVVLPDEILVSDLALKLKATASEVIKKLMFSGMMVGVNDMIDFDTASLIAMEFHAKVEKEVVVTIEERIIDDSEDEDENLIQRAPVVVVMGHVDHGKTSLLDAIRSANVTSVEAGGITQHIGAYRAYVGDQEITFLDTPGHEAFTTMRARGAQVTDIAILVVASDDGIMPQTIEAINHAKSAGVSIIVAINKMDKETANPEKVKQQLTEYELVPEEWGGDIPCIPVSAKTREGLDELLEMVTLVAEMKELRANPDRAAKGTVIEARLDKGRGPIATILVQNGTLRKGDIVVAGTTVGRIRAMINDKGERVETAGPSMPVEITGLDEVPIGGDIFNAVSDERLARELVEDRKHDLKEEKFTAQSKVTLDNLFDQMQLGEMKELKIIVKADVQGSVEAVRQSLVKLANEEVRVNVIHAAVGAVSENDVMLASASNAIIVGFNVRPDPLAQASSEQLGVDVRFYTVIYHCIEEIQSAMRGMRAPKYREVAIGKAECRSVYKISSVGTISGSYVLDGKIARNAQIRVVRDGIVIAEDKIGSLKRFKDDVKEVTTNFECGIGLEKFNDLKEGDIFEAFIMEEYRPD